MADNQDNGKPTIILGPLTRDLPFMFRNVHSMLRSIGASIRGPLDLETGSIGVLFLVWVNPGISQNDLADNLAMKKSAITKLVKSLESQGFIERERLAGDRRMNAIALTSSGHKLVASIRKISVPLNEEVIRGIAPEDIEVFFRVLEKLHTSLASRLAISPANQID